MNRLPRLILVATAIAGLGVAGFLALKTSEVVPEPRNSRAIRSVAPVAAPSAEMAGSAVPGTPVAPDPGERSVEAILQAIGEASVTYDAAALPKIEPYLVHSDPAVREAARDGMIVLGEAAAAPMLRQAAGRSVDPREAVALLEAADYLELPRGSLISSERSRAGRTPLPGRPQSPADRTPRPDPNRPVPGGRPER